MALSRRNAKSAHIFVMSDPQEPYPGESLCIVPYMLALLLLIYGIWDADWTWSRSDLLVAAIIIAVVTPFIRADIRILYRAFRAHRKNRRAKLSRPNLSENHFE